MARESFDRSLGEQTAIISGGLGDIGRATATELGRRGANLAMGDLHPAEDAEAYLSQLRKLGVGAVYHRVDVADAGAVDRWVSNVEREVGTASLIIPNAAVATLADTRHLSAAQWSRELRINLDGAFHLAQAGAQRLLAQGKPGRIVFVGSWAGHSPHVHIPAYSVAKAGVRMLCKCMALELAPFGILVNEVAPGYVDAGLSARSWAENAAQRAAAAAQVPTGQLIAPEEVAAEIAHLCDPANRHCTGSTVLMDGGLSLLGPGRRSKGEED